MVADLDEPLSSLQRVLACLETMSLTANLRLSLDVIRQMIVSGLRLISCQECMSNARIKIVQMSELKGVEDGRYVLQPLTCYNPKQDAFEMVGLEPNWKN